MGVNLSFKIQGKKRLAKVLNGVNTRLKDFREVWDNVADEFFEMEKNQFETQGGAGKGPRWESLSPKYAAWKRKKAPGRPIMVLSGRLKDSLTGTGGENILHKKKTWMEIGTRRKVGRWNLGLLHQEGIKRGSGKVVRKSIDPKETFFSNVLKTIRRFVIAGGGQSGK